ncbi:MAG: alpha/beta fold hydrolase [Leptolyngbya sp. SIO3F4]|nr:alpha/beta fold hydrolase [Leptolyngbya sp. SIO3F4]
MGNYIYLHGFASGPKSYKGRWLKAQFKIHNLDLQLLDFNQKDFAHLTLTRQINQVVQQVKGCEGPTTLIGSSLGGLTAAWAAQESHDINRLILLAPAFQFLEQWLPRLGPEQRNQWATTQWLSIYHYGSQNQQSLHYDFVKDAQRYLEQDLNRNIPTLILHGKQDDVINLAVSRAYACQRPWVTLQPLDTDHGMTDSMEKIWQSIEEFCHL